MRAPRPQCRRPSQSIVCTHIDYDGAVSAAAIVRPRSSELCDGEHGCPAILSMHGTSIPVRDSADAFKHKPAGASDSTEFTFGADRFWLVAPTRHGAHNWEQGGRLTALAALDNLAASSRTHGIASLPAAIPIDAMRVLFVGHSMGGAVAAMLVRLLRDGSEDERIAGAEELVHGVGYGVPRAF